MFPMPLPQEMFYEVEPDLTRRQRQVEILSGLGYGDVFRLGSFEATICGECAATVLLPVSPVQAEDPEQNPILIHRQWHLEVTDALRDRA